MVESGYRAWASSLRPRTTHNAAPTVGAAAGAIAELLLPLLGLKDVQRVERHGSLGLSAGCLFGGTARVPSRCNAYWSPNANGSPKRPLGDFQNNCNISGSSNWRGVELLMDANTVSFYAYNGGILFCYYDGMWRGQNSAYVQVICNR